jgi:hypothetical protein
MTKSHRVSLDLGHRDIFRLSGLVHREWSHALRQRAEDRELECSEVGAVAGFAVRNALEATWEACDALAEDCLCVREVDAAYEVAATGWRQHDLLKYQCLVCSGIDVVVVA